jgi:GT2 family glycosyltransferase
MSRFSPLDLAVIIPTRDRGSVLAGTVDALLRQSVSGFDIRIVVDGSDQECPDLGPSVHVSRTATHAGPGAARNHGVTLTSRPLVLFLGDDVVPSPTFVQSHLERHNLRPEPNIGVLGHTAWHSDVASTPHNRWLDWSGNQFDYGTVGQDAGWARFYSSNVSLKRDFFLRAGGFDEEFCFDYEDLDLGYRLGEQGLALAYEPRALAHHRHFYDWEALTRRYSSRGGAERQMAEKHAWFTPFFASRLSAAQEHPPVSALWAGVATRLPLPVGPLRRRVRLLGDRWYHQQLAAPFFGAWHGDDHLTDLRAYLGTDFDPSRLRAHRQLVDEEERRASDELAFYRTSEAYLYDLTMFATWGTKEPYLAALKRLVPAPARLLDYGCGIGCDGVRLLGDGYDVEFADFDNPSTRYLKWRLDRRGVSAAVHDIESSVPSGFDAVYCFDVIEHVQDPTSLLDTLEATASLVIVNLLEPEAGDTHLHRPLPIRRILDRATAKGLVFYERYGGRSHLIAYRPNGSRSARSWIESLGRRAVGAAHAAGEDLARLNPRGH